MVCYCDNEGKGMSHDRRELQQDSKRPAEDASSSRVEDGNCWVVSLRPETPSGRNQAATGNGLWLETAINWKRPPFLKASGTEKATKGKSPLVGTGLWPETPSRGKPASARQDPPQDSKFQPLGNSGVHENTTKHLKQACSTSRWQNTLTALAGPPLLSQGQ